MPTLRVVLVRHDVLAAADELAAAVADAHARGASWAQIGAVTGMTKQSVWQRWGRPEDRSDPHPPPPRDDGIARRPGPVRTTPALLRNPQREATRPGTHHTADGPDVPAPTGPSTPPGRARPAHARPERGRPRRSRGAHALARRLTDDLSQTVEIT